MFKVKRIHGLTASLGEKTYDRRDTEIRLATMISTIVVIFVVCNSFESIIFILHIQEILPLDVFQTYLRPFADLLMVTNASINVILYCIFKKEFKEKFWQLYIRCNWKNSGKKNVIPLPKENAKIPMIRAQLPKTSVELTSVAYQTVQTNKPTILKTLEEAIPLSEFETDSIGNIQSDEVSSAPITSFESSDQKFNSESKSTTDIQVTETSFSENCFAIVEVEKAKKADGISDLEVQGIHLGSINPAANTFNLNTNTAEDLTADEKEMNATIQLFIREILLQGVDEALHKLEFSAISGRRSSQLKKP